ncbi:hypothetical protein Ancab_005126 [Ancistrocladus abbreviatus]
MDTSILPLLPIMGMILLGDMILKPEFLVLAEDQNYHDHGISGFFTQPDAESRNFGVPSGPDIYRNSDMGAHYQVPFDTGRNPYPYGSHVGYASNSVNEM